MPDWLQQEHASSSTTRLTSASDAVLATRRRRWGDPTAVPPMMRAELVLAHCKRDLSWVSEAMSALLSCQVNVTAVSVYSKCNATHTLGTLPSGARVTALPNVGRCDHAYAHHLASRPPTELEPLVLFLKDTTYHGSDPHFNVLNVPLCHMAAAARGRFDFGCGRYPDERVSAYLRTRGRLDALIGLSGHAATVETPPGVDASAWHHAASLSTFQLDSYSTAHDQAMTMFEETANSAGVPVGDGAAGMRLGRAMPTTGAWTPTGRGAIASMRASAGTIGSTIAAAAEPFAASERPLGQWVLSLARASSATAAGQSLRGGLRHGSGSAVLSGMFDPNMEGDTLLPVCYGGTFAARRHRIARIPRGFWRALEASLSRGDNIEEGHFAERLWAALFAGRLDASDTRRILCASHQVWCSSHGQSAYRGILSTCTESAARCSLLGSISERMTGSLCNLPSLHVPGVPKELTRLAVGSDPMVNASVLPGASPSLRLTPKPARSEKSAETYRSTGDLKGSGPHQSSLLQQLGAVGQGHTTKSLPSIMGARHTDAESFRMVQRCVKALHARALAQGRNKTTWLQYQAMREQCMATTQASPSVPELDDRDATRGMLATLTHTEQPKPASKSQPAGGAQHWYLAPAGSSTCEYGRVATASECEAASTKLRAWHRQTEPFRGTQVGSGGGCTDDELGGAPIGCSLKTVGTPDNPAAGDWATFFRWPHAPQSLHDVPCAQRAHFQLVCSSMVPSAEQRPQETPRRVRQEQGQSRCRPLARTGSQLSLSDTPSRMLMMSTPKGGATVAAQLMFRRLGLLQQAIGYSPSGWIHEYRMKVFNRAPGHAQVGCRNDIATGRVLPISRTCREGTGWRCVKLLRSPFERVVSSYLHTLRTQIWSTFPELSSVCGSPDAAANASFAQFIAALTLRAQKGTHGQPVDNHFMPQATACDQIELRVFYLPVEGLSGALMALGRIDDGRTYNDSGLSSSHYITQAGAEKVADTTAQDPTHRDVAALAFSHFDDCRQKGFAQCGRSVPPYRYFLTNLTLCNQIRCLFAPDFDLYRRMCAQSWLIQACPECVRMCLIVLQRHCQPPHSTSLQVD